MIKMLAMISLIVALSATALCTPMNAKAFGLQAARPAQAESAATAGDEIVSTRHEIKIGNSTLHYTAHAGLLPIRHNETGEIRGKMFFVAYVLDRPRGSSVRPLTFLWNGGPGANASLVHLSGFGPKRINPHDNTADHFDSEWKLTDNETTCLDQTDLVFVDPIGTGFSRPSKAEYGADFYNTLGDIDSFAEFIRVYLTRFDAWDAPLFIGGESYGVWRAAGVTETLLQRGRKVAGVILISGGIPVGPVLSDEMRTALFVPTRTAAAFHHKKLSPDLQADRQGTLMQAEKWARTVYAPALARRDALSDQERDSILKQLASFTAMDVSLMDRKSLTVGRQQFADNLLKSEKQVLARFDTRLTSKEEGRQSYGRQLAVNKYLRSTLQFKTDLAYLGTEQGFSPSNKGETLSAAARWDYNQGTAAPATTTPPNTDSPPGGAQPWLRRAFALQPSLKTFVATGWYDSLNSCAFHEYLVGQLDPAIRSNITSKYYNGGHMMYESPDVREQLRKDVRQFIHDSAGFPSPSRTSRREGQG